MVNRGANKDMELINKRGVFFTVIILFFITLIALSPIFYSVIGEREAVQKRVQSMNSFILSMKEDLERKVYVTSFRSILIIEKKITDSGIYISNFNSSFQEVFFNATLAGVWQELMIGANFTDISNSLQQKAQNININLTLYDPELIIDQNSPWHINVTLKTKLFMVDNSNLASWNTTLVTEVQIPISSFEDPIYLVNTQGKITRQFLKTNYTNFAQGPDVSNLTDHVNRYYYKHSLSAPSFINRLQGVYASSQNGIESLVYLPDLSKQGIPLEQKSVVDYIYFSPSNPSSYQISGMPSWFRLDSSHCPEYNVSCL